MKASRLVPIPLTAVLIAGLVQSVPAAAQPTSSLEASATPAFVASSGWRIAGFAAFKQTKRLQGRDPEPCEVTDAFKPSVIGANSVTERFYAAHAKGESRSAYGAQYVVELASDAEATAAAKEISSSIRKYCTADARAGGKRSFTHELHMRFGGAGSSVDGAGNGELAVWSTAYQGVVLVEVANGSRGMTRRGYVDDEKHMYVMTVGHVGRVLTVLTVAVEDQLTNPPWKDLRRTARTAVRLLAADPWSA